MKELEDLTDIEKTVLLACCDANNFSLSAHNPIELIIKRVKGLEFKQKVKYIKNAINKLLTNGFLIQHPTRNNMTYELSKKGLDAGNKLK